MTSIGIATVDELLADADARPNARGNLVRRMFFPADRYLFDIELDRERWGQFDTASDAAYFGTWVDKAGRRILSYAEGDVTLVECPDAKRYDLEMAEMCRFHKRAPAFSVLRDGVLTRYYQDRSEWFVDPANCPDQPLDETQLVDDGS